MFYNRIISVRSFIVAFGMVFGAVSAMASTPRSTVPVACENKCSMRGGDQCPADEPEMEELCTEQGDECFPAGYCAMGLCYDENGNNYWVIACTDEPD